MTVRQDIAALVRRQSVAGVSHANIVAEFLLYAASVMVLSEFSQEGIDNAFTEALKQARGLHAKGKLTEDLP